MRGDRPAGRDHLHAQREATPHARGSTPRYRLAPYASIGYPACAGIDPGASTIHQSVGWLPRMRGDRPALLQRPLALYRATPHARGSTSAGGQTGRCVSGLPRMRGDRPISAARSARTGPATPHARGSTPAQGRQRRRCPGYPACAGIDLLRDLQGLGAVRLPRMRGDRPPKLAKLTEDLRATPHARGSTASERRRHHELRGYPACAGIDLLQLPCPPPTAWLPRMRGDRPFWADMGPTYERATPHARGSTCAQHRLAVEFRGYPACAGIDPISATYAPAC